MKAERIEESICEWHNEIDLRGFIPVDPFEYHREWMRKPLWERKKILEERQAKKRARWFEQDSSVTPRWERSCQMKSIGEILK